MTLDEIRVQYKDEMRVVNETYKYSVQKWLVEHKLDGRVRRKKDGKMGWLDLDHYMSLNFYPQTKRGGRSLNSSGYVSLRFVEEEFEPITEGEEK